MKTSTRISVFVLACLALLVSANSIAQELGAPDRIDGDREHAIAAPDDLVNVDTPWSELLQDAIDRAINPDDYVCNAPTVMQVWVNERAREIDPISLVTLGILGVFGATSNSVALQDHDASDEFIGTFGQFTRELVKRHKDNQRFWDVPTDDILLMGMHGSILADDERMLDLLSILGIPPALAVYMLETAQTIIEGGEVDLTVMPLIFPAFPPPFAIKYTAPGVPSEYNHPLLTLNAFAVSAGGVEIPGIGLIPDKMVM